MNRHAFIPLIFFLLLLWFTNLPVSSVLAASALPRHRIALSFSIKDSLVNGTSQWVIPGDVPLRLDCGPLLLTGLVLEQRGMAPQTLKTDRNNTLSLPPAHAERMLTISWQLRVATPGDNDNLITAEGIALTGFWHPVADRDLLFSLEAVIPDNFEAICEANVSKTGSTPQGKRFVASFDQPVRSLHFIAGPYVVQTKQLADITLFTYLFREDASLAKGYLNKTAEMIRRYQNLIGSYPFKRFAIVENRLPTGYGLPTFTLLGQAVIRLPFIMERSLGHEILHSWFGNSIMLSDGGGNWSEGLTTYLADQSFAAEANQGPSFRKAQLIRYRAYVHQANAIPLSTFQNSADHQGMEQMARAVGYDKASMVFHMLRNHVGESAFNNGLQHFYRQMRGKRAGWQDVEAAFAQASGEDLHPFFRQWLERTDLPEITIEKSKIDQRKGRAILSFDLVQGTQQPYLLDIPIRVSTIRGEISRTLHTDTVRKAVSLELDSLPTELVLDGQYDLMRQLDPAETPPTWSQFLGAEQTAVLLPDAGALPTYQALIATLGRRGCRLVSAGSVDNRALAQGSWLFLGDSALRRSLFAEPENSEKGFTLDVHRSPLNPEEVMVLVDSASAQETDKVVSKLNHYGPYSRLRFSGGQNVEKTTSATTEGMVFPLIDKPRGIPAQATCNFEQIIDALVRARVVYVGETHTDYGNHLLQLQIIQALHARNPLLAIGLEMFPRSSQHALDDSIQGRIDEREFIKASHYFEVWGYDYRLYRDLIAYAKAQRIPLIGLNLDKEISRQVFATGSTDGLTPGQQAQIAQDRDLDIAGYRQRLEEAYLQHASPHGAGFSGFLQAQALWDETMAESIVKTIKRYPGRQILVLAGNGHVVKDNGMPPRVARRLPGITQKVVTAAGDGELGKEQVDYFMFAQRIDLEPTGKLGVILKEEGKKGTSGRMKISGISPHGLAGQAGLREEDCILAIDNVPVADLADIKYSLLDKKAGDIVRLQIRRGQQQLTVPVELSAMSAERGLPPGHPKL